MGMGGEYDNGEVSSLIVRYDRSFVSVRQERHADGQSGQH